MQDNGKLRQCFLQLTIRLLPRRCLGAWLLFVLLGFFFCFLLFSLSPLSSPSPTPQHTDYIIYFTVCGKRPGAGMEMTSVIISRHNLRQMEPRLEWEMLGRDWGVWMCCSHFLLNLILRNRSYMLSFLMMKSSNSCVSFYMVQVLGYLP